MVKIPSLFLLVFASFALAAQNSASYTFSQSAAPNEPQAQTFELLRTSYVVPATPVVVLPTPTAAGSPTIVTPTASATVGTTTPPSSGSSAPVASECPTMCLAMYKPVCGSNGKTYSNACELAIAQCHTPAAKIAMMAEGECTENTSAPEPASAAPPSPATPISSQPAVSPVPTATTVAPTPAATTSAPMPATTTVVPAPSASMTTPSTPKCSQTCTSDFTPLCGSDGKTYSNACELAVAQCQSPQMSITKAADGECGAGASTSPEPAPQTPASTPPASASTPTPATSAPTPANAKCTQTCTSDFTPLCGSDGKTYSNVCALAVAQCKNPTANLVKSSDGECGGSGSGSASPAPSTPGAAGTLAPVTSPSSPPKTHAPKPSESKCEMACSKLFAPVCGSNGMTYNNVCELRLANCKAGGSGKVAIASQGACKSTTLSTGSSSTIATSTTATTTSTTTAATASTATTGGGGKDSYLRGSGNSPIQSQ